MEEWINFLHSFLELSNYPILKDKGKISALKARLKAEQEYEKYRVIQDKNYISDFDKEIQLIVKKKWERIKALNEKLEKTSCLWQIQRIKNQVTVRPAG